MSDTIPHSEVPEDIGRNDPCPCGSGKKYKKCCQKVHRVQQQASKRSRSVEELVTASTGPWDMFKLLSQIRENNLPGLFFDMFHAQGPLREQYDSREAYLSAIADGEAALAVRAGADLRRIRHDGPDVYLLLEQGTRDPEASHVNVEIVVLRPNEIDADRQPREVEHSGWRVWDVLRHEVRKAEVDGELDFTRFGIEWAPAWTP